MTYHEISLKWLRRSTICLLPSHTLLRLSINLSRYQRRRQHKIYLMILSTSYLLFWARIWGRWIVSMGTLESLKSGSGSWRGKQVMRNRVLEGGDIEFAMCSSVVEWCMQTMVWYSLFLAEKQVDAGSCQKIWPLVCVHDGRDSNVSPYYLSYTSPSIRSSPSGKARSGDKLGLRLTYLPRTSPSSPSSTETEGDLETYLSSEPVRDRDRDLYPDDADGVSDDRRGLLREIDASDPDGEAERSFLTSSSSCSHLSVLRYTS